MMSPDELIANAERAFERASDYLAGMTDAKDGKPLQHPDCQPYRDGFCEMYGAMQAQKVKHG